MANASDFLKRRAAQREQTQSTQNSGAPSLIANNGGTAPRASTFLQNRAAQRRAVIDQRYGKDAYGGSGYKARQESVTPAQTGKKVGTAQAGGSVPKEKSSPGWSNTKKGDKAASGGDNLTRKLGTAGAGERTKKPESFTPKGKTGTTPTGRERQAVVNVEGMERQREIDSLLQQAQESRAPAQKPEEKQATGGYRVELERPVSPQTAGQELEEWEDVDTAENTLEQWGQELEGLEREIKLREKKTGALNQELLGQYQALVERYQRGYGAYLGMLSPQELERAKRYANYAAIPQAVDFEEKSAYQSTRNGKKVKRNALSGVYTETGFDDILYDYINGDKEARERQAAIDVGAGGYGSLYTDTHSGWDNLPEEVVKTFNYIYATEGKEAAYDYIKAAADQGITGINSLALNFANAMGVFSMSALAEKGLNAFSGKADAPSAFYEDLQRDLIRAQEQNPVASTVGSVSGTLALMGSIATGVGAIPGFASMTPIAQSVVSGAASMGGTTAIQNAGYAVTGMESLGDYGLDILTSTGAGAASGLAAGGIGAASRTVLQRLGLTQNMLARTVAAGFTGAGGAAARAGVRQGSDMLRGRGEFDSGALLEEALVGFAFSAIGFLTRNFTASPQSAAAQDEGEALAKKYFKGMTQEEAKAEYRRLARIYHPDLYMNDTEEAKAAAEAIMKEINAAWGWLNKTSGAQFYQDMQTAKYSEDAASYQNAKRGFDSSVAEITALAAGGAFPGQEAQDAVSILEAVSKGGAISPAGDGTGITDSGAIIPVAPADLPAGIAPDAQAALPADLPAGIAPDAQAALQRAAEEMYAPGETDTRAETPASTGEAGGKSGSNRDTYTVINRLKESIPELEQEQPVAQVSLAEIEAASGENMAERARKLFEKIKGVVTRQGFGEVEINSRSVKDDLSHGVGLAKAAVVPAIPSIIREGRQIDFQQNWKGRAYDGYVFAAPVTMDGETVYVAAVVKKSSKNRFYLHEVVDSNGNILKMNSGEGATQTSLATNGDAGTRSPLLSPTIAQTGDGEYRRH